jgi:hypothetical protein
LRHRSGGRGDEQPRHSISSCIEPTAEYALRKVGDRVGTPSLKTDPDVDFVPTEEYVPTRRLDPLFGRALAEL